MTADEVRIERFRPPDQAAVRALVLAGLTDHWGTLDPDLNHDLDDIATTYADGITLVARFADQIVGTATLMPRAAATYEVVRMAVASGHRRRGIGTSLLTEMVARASAVGAHRLVLETAATWDETVAFYRHYGFRVTHESEGRFGRDISFALDLTPALDRPEPSRDPG